MNGQFEVKLITCTQDAEKNMAYIARVSNPENQDNPDYAKLLKYCIKHQHWSVFESSHMTLEITTSRAIAAQILRHRSFTFQEFSQRYAEAQNYINYEARRQDTKNRQNSIDDLLIDTQLLFNDMQEELWDMAKSYYDIAINRGIAKECARFLLPLNTQTTMYMTGNVRSWITYINLRTEEGTQLEHREIAEACKKEFIKQFPIVAEALEWV